jgi:hypothetical protein
MTDESASAQHRARDGHSIARLGVCDPCAFGSIRALSASIAPREAGVSFENFSERQGLDHAQVVDTKRNVAAGVAAHRGVCGRATVRTNARLRAQPATMRLSGRLMNRPLWRECGDLPAYSHPP